MHDGLLRRLNIILSLYFLQQGEIEIKDFDRSNVVIEIEKLGATEEKANSIIVNQTIFDVGHGTIFVLQLVSN